MKATVEINPDDFLSISEIGLEAKFSNLVGTRFFVGPLTKSEAANEIKAHFAETQPALVYKSNGSYFCIYP